MDTDQLRIASPSMLIVAAVLFCLPWVNVSCRTPDGEVVRISQTGAQAALGRTTVSIVAKDGQVFSGDMPFPPGGNFGGNGLPGVQQPGDGTDPAPLLWLYVLALLGGAGAGFAMPGDRPRMTAVGACGAGAAALLALQLVAGFPLLNDLPQEMPVEKSFSVWLWLSLLVTFAVPVLVLIERAARRGSAAPIREGERDDDLPWTDG